MTRRSKSRLCWALTALLGSGVAVAAEPLPPDALLQKLSLKLSGTVPSSAESAAFRARVAAAPERFAAIYDAQVEAYLASPAFRDVIETFHAVWWRLPQRETTALAAFVVDNDRPYWELFDRSYVYLDGRAAEAYRAVGIETETTLPTVTDDWRVVRLADHETRFRSILSHLDLLNQYPDTPTNKNRARANHVFRTFLCESLVPTTPTPFDDDPPLAGDDPHGTDPDCVGCHYRLDPLARFFDQWRPPLPFSVGTWFDPTQAASGRLIVRPEGQPPRSYPGATETELARVLISEPVVHGCVVRRVWEFVHGSGVKMPDVAQTTLVQAFDRRASFKDLIKETLRHPYFWSTDEAPPLRFGDVRSVFQGCGGGCHRVGGRIEPAFDPMSYPFAATPDDNVALLKRVWGAITHGAGYSPMPRPVGAPKLPPESLAQIREWIVASALDDQGRPTLTDAQIMEVLDE